MATFAVCCVSQLLARTAPDAYTNRVCAEGLHFSAFHFIGFISCRITFYELIGIGQKILWEAHLTKFCCRYGMRVLDTQYLVCYAANSIYFCAKVPFFPQNQSPMIHYYHHNLIVLSIIATSLQFNIALSLSFSSRTIH